MNDRPTSPIKIIRARIRANRVADAAWKTAVFFAGFFLIGVGLVLLVLPGPGWVMIFIGLFTLATEFTWASRFLAPLRLKLEKAKLTGKKPIWIYLLFLVVTIIGVASSWWVWVKFER
jgi:uncharacterized protein (TIGR02611 family)